MRSITPVIAVVVLTLMAVSAAGMAYLTITTYQTEAQSGTQTGIERISTRTKTQLKIESVSGGQIYLRNLGSETFSNPSFYVEGKPLNVSGPLDCEPGKLCVYTILENVTCSNGCDLSMGEDMPVGTSVIVEEEELGSEDGGEAGPYCGDGSCNGIETPATCPQDCPLLLPWQYSRHDSNNTGYTPETTTPSQPGTFQVRNFTHETATIGAVVGSPLVGDVNGDGAVEVIVSGGQGGSVRGPKVYYGINETIIWQNDTVPSIDVVLVNTVESVDVVLTDESTGIIYSFYGSNGTVKWSYSPDTVSTNLAVFDIDGDGSQDVIFGQYSGTTSSDIVVLYGNNGTQMWSYSHSYYDGESTSYPKIYSTPAISDIDNDGFDEIVFGSDYTGSSCPVINSIYAINGTVKMNNTISDDNIRGAPALADLDNDGDLEIVIATEGINSYVYAFYENGTLMWTYDALALIQNDVAVADINNDNNTEVVVGVNDDPPYIRALYGINGTQMWSHTITDLSSPSFNSPVIGDVDGDGSEDVIYTKLYDYDEALWPAVVTVYGINGTEQSNQTFGPPYPGNLGDSPALADVDGDNIIEIVFVASDDV